ncbi:bifunctional DNA-formamidopyrimidine glycosylase/DNA-(apurinic or apyrimidinic site) lyase [Candidatus Woesebacteria bacterium]|nr:bifunctional DNA-formamidopyrimidine glycosylase/DNA-(apurinic or apyrimidinic site) lyase [Candidatus Woesebacteria bacterium]
MPELPEVETVKLGLTKYLIGHRILKVDINNPKVFSGNTENIEGAKVKDVRRFAKVLSIDLDNDFSIIIHIKLTGQLIYRGPNLPNPTTLSKKVIGGVPGKHTHIVFELDRKGFLYYNDLRRFGWLKVIKTSDVETSSFIGKLGPEPFGKIKGKPSLLTRGLFKEILSKSSRPIKIVIMDQEKMGGVGNIYAADALWLAKISPKRSANSLAPNEQIELYGAILEVLKRGLKWGGASELMFVTPDGSEGEYQNHTLAYGHQGEVCERCHKAKFEKYFLGGRGTYVCPNCQK